LRDVVAREKQEYTMFDNLRELLRVPGFAKRLAAMTITIFTCHLVILIGLLWHASSYPTLLGLGILAYGLGLRHAVDPDHIAAIDNTTRKLMQDGKKPVAVGFFFALGHSTIVIVMSVAIALAASSMNEHLSAWRGIGSLISTSASCGFLLLIGAINLVVLIDTYKAWQRVKAGAKLDSLTLDQYLSGGGLLSRILRPVLRLVGNSWSMFWVGLLFGLGFDTASEVALLSISGTAGAHGMPLAVAILIPLAFTAGMTFIDTLDGVLMLGAYGWAFLQPVRKLYYNMSITLMSVIIALFIGGVEGLQIVSDQAALTGFPWDWVNSIHLENWGFYIIGLFALGWIGSMLLYKWRRYDRLDKGS
jgi:nickel/cobalt transporter (NiCoT) family protein